VVPTREAAFGYAGVDVKIEIGGRMSKRLV